MVEGRLIGIDDGVLTGWIAAGEGEGAYLEAEAHGETPFGRTRAEPGEDGRARFAIPIPPAYRDGRMRFFDVRPLGGGPPLPGGPVAFDGGLFASLELQAETDSGPPIEPPPLVEGLVAFQPPSTVEGWAWAPGDPARRLGIEILAGGRLAATIVADRPMSEPTAGDGRHGFRVDLARLLRYGPHEMVIRAAGMAAPLPGGAFRSGVFAADGEVDCPGYLDSADDRAELARLPFEHQARAALRMEPARLVQRMINRLRRERTLSAARAGEPVLLLALPGAGDATLAAWRLQSHPATAALDAAAGVVAIREAAGHAAFVVFAGPGDMLHPSGGGILAGLAEADGVTWARFCAEAARAGAPGTRLGRPAFDPATARHGAISDTTLALRGAVVAEAPAPVLAALAEGRMHPLWVWLAGRKLRWSAHPEALTSSVGDWSPPSRELLGRDEALCRDLLADADAPFAVANTAARLPTPWVLVPTGRASRTSALVPFRDRAELTLRCIHALAGQRLTGELELVLVDNRSEPGAAERVIDGARRMLGEGRVVALEYDAPFNHSAQNNLAARTATGEVLVICNNDVALKDPALLEQLGAWALQPGVATVGCRLEDPERGLGAYGHVFAPPADDPFQPPLRENPDPAYGLYVHAVPGNTLALAAIRRDLYLELGGLDESRFPIGYNDVEFMLRASARGLTHLYLGHVDAEHRRGSSRTGDDEDLQALWINQAYPSAAQGHLRQLAHARIGASSDASADLAAQPSPEDAALLERLEALVRRQAEGEARRAEPAAVRAPVGDPKPGTG